MLDYIVFLLQRNMVSTAAERYLLMYMVMVLVIIAIFVIVFFVVFIKRKNKFLLDKIEQKQAYEKEIVLAKTETQEQILKNIGWELHDNIGQLLAFANMQLSILKAQVPDNVKDKFKETSEALSESLKEVRMLSKTLNNDVVLNLGLEKSLANELSRLKKMKFKTANMIIKGVQADLVQKNHEIIIFRILQEFLSNTVKYSNAENIKIILEYSPQELVITASDDGKGFDVNQVEKGSGLINMKSRAALIHATLNIKSKLNEGVSLIVKYPMLN